MDLNSCCFSGRIVFDAEMKESTNGLAIVTFSLAINETRKSKTDEKKYEKYANFINCVFFGNYAKAIYRALKRGTYVTINCKLKQERWTHFEEKHQRIVFIVNELAFLFPSKKENDSEFEKTKWQKKEIENAEEPKELTENELLENGIF